ncbi:trehalase-domain-containing protein [Metschnikowia bicuspidata]|uniref:Trehalase n=1 Tax=Metschnikowia bicuspidata TaxID=27322 RepID=A0A4V1J3Q5_9ASCO|nr:trehalase-domain-containing protein [Metschnikowia bicuspidata]
MLEGNSGSFSPDPKSTEALDAYPADLITESIPKKLSHFHIRRASSDDAWNVPRRFLVKDINATLEELLQNEDTNHHCQITIEDLGPKTISLGTANSNGFRQSAVRGTYMLSNLLQELTIAKRFGRTQMILDESRLCENPVTRMKRLINTLFWPALTRQIPKDNIIEMARDTKIVEEAEDENRNIIKKHESVRLYVPYNRPEQYEYFSSIIRENPTVSLDVQYLPKVIDAEFIKSINKKPGLLALQTQQDPTDPKNLIHEPYVVPGGRFNEFYGWDSYMIMIGLLLDVTPENQRNLKLSRGMTENFIYEITHYNKILNANRSYYLGRSQPPFLTDMALKTFEKTLEVNPDGKADALNFLKRSTLAAIREYNIVWCCPPRLDPETNLSCYHPEVVGIPPETEASHFNAILKDFVEKYNITQQDFIEKYNNREILEPDLDEYFLHDSAVRESGHDTTYRLEGKAAYLATVDLNSLLYKYEIDIANIIKDHFDDAFENPESGKIEKSADWFKKAKQRQENITKYLWSEKDLIFYDYHVKEKKQHKYESATCFWPLYSGAATMEQADKLVKVSLPKFEEYGGLVSGTLRLRGEIGIHRPSKQWDYPYGWAPQQILAWIGLANYNYNGAARRLVYRWLHMMTRAFVDYNGVIVEKYNVLKGAVPHRVDAEYGNQGADFKGVATEGFGWVNASFLFGLTFLNLQAQRSIGVLIPPDTFLANLNESQRDLYA